MKYWRFLAADAVGCTLWVSVYLLLGRIFHRQIDSLILLLGLFGRRAGLIVLILIGLFVRAKYLEVRAKYLERRRFIRKRRTDRISPPKPESCLRAVTR
jgi:membrane protein DedA with SNARE-associated domain